MIRLEDIPKEPTDEQCTAQEVVFENDSQIGYAMWYPQMGGYVGKAVVVLDREWYEGPHGARKGGCFDVLVWHDGEFPFSGDMPVHLHHCDPQQFIRFGEDVALLNDEGRIR